MQLNALRSNDKLRRMLGLGYFLTCGDVTQSEEADADVSVHRPLLCLAVWAAAVIHEARKVPFKPSVNHAILLHTQTA